MVFDVADLDDPVLAAVYDSGTAGIDHNQYVVGDFLYQANYRAGLVILDASDPTNLREVARFDTTPDSFGSVWDGAWSVYPFFEGGPVLISSIGQGLFILQPTASGVLVNTDQPSELPSSVRIAPAFPNPFTATTRVSLASAADQQVLVQVFDLLGRERLEVMNAFMTAGAEVDLEIAGADLSPGTYLVRVTAGAHSEVLTVTRLP
jgi:hypothetical protein